jgi:predicted transposase YdaD
MDLLCRLDDGSLLHVELQSSNNPDMAARMADYALRVRRRYKRMPRQFVLYVGRGPMRMPTAFQEGRMSFDYELVNLRDLDGELLLGSRDLGDNVLAVLAKLADRKDAVARIVRSIGKLPGLDRDDAIQQLYILAGLRGLEQTVEEEVSSMPIVVDLMKNKVLGREIRKELAAARAKGMAEGIVEGKVEGVREGEWKILRRLMTKRFGIIPAWVDEKLATISSEELESLGLRLLDARSIDELLQA